MVSPLILIVDDDPMVLTEVGGLLQSAGFHSVSATNGLEGLKLLQALNPGLVILDVTMPELDGMQTCRMIRADQKYRNVPILMMTASGDIRDMLEARKMGADDYIVKPVDPAALIHKVERLLAR